MSGLTLVVGLGIVGLLLMLLFFKLGEGEGERSHWILQVLMLGFIVGVMVLIGKATMDDQDNCSWLTNSTTVTGNTTSYTHVYTCNDNANNTARTFYDVTVWILRIVGIYILLYFAWSAFNYLNLWKRGER